MDGCWGTVTVRRAASGMPLLEADQEPAAFFGLGYAQASDDLDGLLRQYLLVRGELSNADGPHDDAAERDANQRLWRVHEEARQAFAGLPAELQDCYRAFIAGVGARMEERPESVPSWAPPLDPSLPIGVNRTVMLYWTISDAVQALRAAGVPLPPVVSELDRTPMIPGSNAWAVLPDRTRDGETFLVSDPHLPFGGVHTMHEATVATPSLHYTGFTFLGAMLPALAHNASCAWGVTTGGPRVSDAYRVPDTVADAVEVNGVRSPIVARQDGWAYAICSPYTGLIGETEQQFLAMLRSRTVGELRSAFERSAFPPQNVIAADCTGAAWYVRTGRVPRRPEGAAGILEPHQRWDGFLRPDELVHLDEPSSGFLQNCNSAPDTVAPELAAAGWHPDAFNDRPGRETSRSLRSTELLSSVDAATIDDVTAWAVEDRWPDTPSWRAGLADAVAAQPDRVETWSPARRALLSSLLEFQGSASPWSITASAWLAWRTRIARTPVDPKELRTLTARHDPELLLGALEAIDTEHRPYGEDHRFASGEPGRGGGFISRPPLADDEEPAEQVTIRATYFADGIAVGGGPALRIVRFGSEGMSSSSLLLPRRADVFSRGGVLPTAFAPEDAEVECVLDTDGPRAAETALAQGGTIHAQ